MCRYFAAQNRMRTDLICGSEDGGQLRPPVIWVLVAIPLLLQQDTFLLQGFYDSCRAFLQNSEACVSGNPQHNWCPALPSAILSTGTSVCLGSLCCS